VEHPQPSNDLPASCAYLLALPAFGDFLAEVRRLKDIVVQDLMTNKVEDHETFVGYRAKYLAFDEVLEMAEFQAEMNIDQGE